MKAIFQFGTQEDLPEEVNHFWFRLCGNFARKNNLRVSTGTCFLNFFDEHGRLSEFGTGTEFIFRPSEYKRLPADTYLAGKHTLEDGSKCYIYCREIKQNET